MPRTQTYRHNALPFDGEDTWLACKVADDGAVARLRERNHRVAALDQIELNLDHMVDSVPPEQAEHHHRHGKGNANDGQRCYAMDAPRNSGAS